MNWDYKHSLSIQIERQRCNISCGPRRWKWFIFKDVAAYFHYFKVLLISMVLEMTNSHVQEEQAHGGWDFSACQWRRRDHKGLAAYVVQKPKSYLCQAAPHQPRITRLLEELWFLTFNVYFCFCFCFFPRPSRRAFSASSLHPSLCNPHTFRPRSATQPPRHLSPTHQLLSWHLLEWRAALCSLEEYSPSSLLPFEGS